MTTDFSNLPTGGLITLAKFHLKWPVKECSERFEALALRCFQGSKSILGRFRAVFNYLATDAIYDEATLEDALKEAFGVGTVLFENVVGEVAGTRVAVTATSHGNSRFILANYNGTPSPTQKSQGMEWYPYWSTKLI